MPEPKPARRYPWKAALTLWGAGTLASPLLAPAVGLGLAAAKPPSRTP